MLIKDETPGYLGPENKINVFLQNGKRGIANMILFSLHLVGFFSFSINAVR